MTTPTAGPSSVDEQVDERRSRFARLAFLGLTVAAAHQTRGETIFAQKDGHERVQRDLRGRLLNLEATYRDGGVSDAAHIEHIVEIADGLSATHGAVLAQRRYRIGVAQKALNLWLKYLWCDGLINQPPHCPFDWNIIRRLNLRDVPDAYWRTWTIVDDIEAYTCWVREARAAAGPLGLSLPEWELFVWAGIMPPTRIPFPRDGASDVLPTDHESSPAGSTEMAGR